MLEHIVYLLFKKGHSQLSCPEFNFQEEPFKTCLSLLVKFPDPTVYTYRILDLIGFAFLQLKTPLNYFLSAKIFTNKVIKILQISLALKHIYFVYFLHNFYCTALGIVILFN